jgi:hypothetical protein
MFGEAKDGGEEERMCALCKMRDADLLNEDA